MKLTYLENTGIVPNDRYRIILGHAFDVAQRRLGLVETRDEIALLFSNDKWCANADGQVAATTMRPIPMMLSAKCGPVKAIDALSHEMVHVRDIIRGDLYQLDRDTVVFRGQKFSRDFIETAYTGAACRGDILRDLPLEREPYTLGPLIAAEAIKTMPLAGVRHLATGLKITHPDAGEVRRILLAEIEEHHFKEAA